MDKSSWTFGGVFGRLRALIASLFSDLLGGSRVDADETIAALKGVAESRDPRTGHPELVKRVQELIAAYERNFPGRKVIPTCFYRSVAEQQRIFKSGRFGNPGPILTKCDGIKKKSKHNFFPSRACDLAVIVGGKAIWKEEMYWPLGALAKACGLVWGGDWNGDAVKQLEDFDLPHVQLPGDVA